MQVVIMIIINIFIEFDNTNGDYSIIIGDHINYRFEIKSLLGHGSFGQVLKAFDHKTGNQVAIKVIKNVEKFSQQALIEVNILRHLNEKVIYI